MITWRTKTMILISMKNKMRVMMKMRKKTLINISDMLVLVDWKVILLRLKSLKRKILHLLLITWLKNRSRLIGNLGEL